MVMTRKMSPRVSGAGLLLAVAGLSAGAMLTPTLACPPEKEERAALAVDPVASSRVIMLDEPVRSRAMVAGAPMRGVSVVQPDRRRAAGDLEARMSRLEAQVDRLVRLMEGRAAGAGHAPDAVSGGARHMTPPSPPRPARIAERPARIAEEPMAIHERPAVIVEGGTTQQSYQVSEGKLDDLWTLMARADVPVVVSRGEGSSIVVHGTAAQQRAFKAFVDIIDPKGGGASAAPADEARRLLDRAIRQSREAAPEAVVGVREHRAHGEVLRRQAQQIERQADRLEERAEHLEERADALIDRAEEDGSRDSEHFEKQAVALMEQAEMLLAEAEALRDEVDRLEHAADEAYDRADEAEDAVDAVEDAHEHDHDKEDHEHDEHDRGLIR